MLQKDLAEKAGLSVSFVSEIENDKRSIGADALLRIAEVLGASLDYLVRGMEPPQQEPKPLVVPPTLAEAAERHGWTYSVTASLLAAAQAVLARRSPAAGSPRPLKEWTADDWVRLHRSLFPQ
jgi:transcriptional regulator with XRE-family HTH domain